MPSPLADDLQQNKALLTLLIIRCALTVNLAIGNHMFLMDSEDQLQRRAFLVFSRTLSGCMMGAFYANEKFSFTLTYEQCKDLAFREKAAYIK